MIPESLFGISKFSIDHQGTGGKMRVRPEDFRVIEIDDNGILVTEKGQYGGGIYHHGIIDRKALSHQQTIRLLGKFFSIPDEQIHLGGIKDKNAVISQEFSVFNPRKNGDFTEVLLEDGFSIRSLGHDSKRVIKGHIWGNWFDIRVTGARNTGINFTQLLDELGTYNYYGYQRFGGTRPITAQFGRYLLLGDLKNAVDIYLGGKSYGDDENYRKLWRDTHDAELVLNEWLHTPQFERKMLEVLVKTPSDYRRALERLPRNIKNFSQMAFISLLFNEYISMREDTILKGERSVVVNGKQNVEIALPSNKWPTPLNELWASIFDKHEFVVKSLKEIRHSSRMARLFPQGFEHTFEEDSLHMKFALPTGSYATTIMREIMRVDPADYL